MSANTNPIFPATIRTVGTEITEEDAGVQTTVFSAGWFGSAVTKIVACNSHETDAIDIMLFIRPAEATDCIIPCGTFSIPAMAGITSAPVSLLPAGLLDADDKLFLGSTSTGPSMLRVAPVTNMPIDMFISIMVMASDY